MRYYVMEPPEKTLLPAAPKGDDAGVVKTVDVNRFEEIDYDSRNELVSDRLKMLLEQYMTRYNFQPVVYLDFEKKEQVVFWRFKPPIYEEFKADFRNDGIISRIAFNNNDAPLIFTARSPKGIRSIVVRMAVAESALRRCILGLKFTKILEYDV
ncbi:MAG: hypothetical protein FWH57_02200 [Oscillospiraceae bacterium]|nr:hypothetical protein [Oscillospiraceae bacterium]